MIEPEECGIFSFFSGNISGWNLIGKLFLNNDINITCLSPVPCLKEAKYFPGNRSSKKVYKRNSIIINFNYILYTTV